MRFVTLYILAFAYFQFSFIEGEYGNFIKFEPVTLVPFEPKLIRFEKLTPEQIDWYNRYNELVIDQVGSR